MLRKNYCTSFLAVALFLTGGLAVFAQTAPVRGKVELKKADGTFEPVAGAVIDVYRTDVKGKLPSGKTDKKGTFAFAGLPLGTFAFSISAPNVKPEVFPNIKAGNEAVNITVVAGDGKRLTEEEARQAVTAIVPTAAPGAKPVELTAEQKKAQAEYEKQVAEITAKNTKTVDSDKLINKVLQEGNAAYKEKNYDLAIIKFDEGYKASPDYVGSAPVLLINKALSLKFRGIDLYNQNVKSTDVAAKVQNMNKVSKDFADAVDAYNLSWKVLKDSPAAERGDLKSYEANKVQTLNGLKELIKVMVTTEKVDTSKTGVIKALVQEYFAVETNQAAKAEAQVSLADIYRIAADPDNAIIEYRKALEISPDNPDALAGLGLSLFDAGERSNNNEQRQEGLNYMQRFAETAPSNHKLKESVAGAVEYLKSQKLVPQKVTKGATKKKS